MEIVQLENTVPEPSREGSVEFDLLEDGMHQMGLVKISNCDIKNKKTGEVKPGYRLSFRDKDLANGYVNISFTASTNEKSNMFKNIKAMTGTIKEGVTREEIFNAMVGCLGKWFSIMTVQNPVGDKTYINALSIKPSKEELPHAVSYFESVE